MKRLVGTLLLLGALAGKVYAGTIADVESELAATRAAMAARQEEISDALQREGILNQELSEILAAIRAGEETIAGLNETMRGIQAEIDATEAQMAKVRVRQGERTALLHQRIRSAYSGERSAVWQSLLSASSFDEFAARRVYLDRLARQDQEILAALEADQAELTRIQDDLADQQARLAAVRREQEQLIVDLRAQENEKQVLLAQAEWDQETAAAALSSLEEISAELERELARLIAEEQRKSGLTFSGSFGSPLDGYLQITDNFGSRIHPIYGTESVHYGVDFAANSSDPIYASAAGEVILAQWYGGYGNAVVIDHGDGYSTLYGHASALLVSAGERVERGDVIARVGTTGVSTGPHLHFEIRIGGEATDPLPYLQ